MNSDTRLTDSSRLLYPDVLNYTSSFSPYTIYATPPLKEVSSISEKKLRYRTTVTDSGSPVRVRVGRDYEDIFYSGMHYSNDCEMPRTRPSLTTIVRDGDCTQMERQQRQRIDISNNGKSIDAILVEQDDLFSERRDLPRRSSVYSSGSNCLKRRSRDVHRLIHKLSRKFIRREQLLSSTKKLNYGNESYD